MHDRKKNTIICISLSFKNSSSFIEFKNYIIQIGNIYMYCWYICVLYNLCLDVLIVCVKNNSLCYLMVREELELRPITLFRYGLAGYT